MKFGVGQKIKSGLWLISFILVGIFFGSLVSLSFGNFNKKIETQALVTEYSVAQEEGKEEAPKYFYFIRDASKKPRVSAEAYLVGDLDTGEIILEKNSTTKFSIASVSKLMTALVSKEIQDQNESIKITRQALATEGENGNLRLNENVKVGDILYPLLLESSNDAAEAIAIHGERETFIQKMNAVAKDLGLENTSFNDPSGLSPQNQSTSSDLFKLAKYIKEKSSEIFEITTKRSFKNDNHVWFSNNQFVKEEGYLGGKSGFINASRQTVISLFTIPLSSSSDLAPRNVAITLLRSSDRKKDVGSILTFLKQNIYYGSEAENKTAFTLRGGVPEVKEPDFVTLSFAGDIMLDRGVRSSVMKNFGGDYSKLFENLDLLKKSDIVFANLEGPASDRGIDKRNLYSFRMDPSTIPALRGGGIGIVSVANNHVGDWGMDAYTDTLERLAENEILYTGGGLDKASAEQPTIIEKYGMKIGYLGFSDVGPASMEAKVDRPGILLASDPRYDEIIRNASKQVDHLIVSIHFGDEYKTLHNKRQEYLSHRAVDAGAKIVAGHHPHVIEDTEVYGNGYIIYSLGNFIFDQAFSTETMQGLLAEIKLSKDGSMTVKKNIIKLNRTFQPEKVILGKEEKVKFEFEETTSQ